MSALVRRAQEGLRAARRAVADGDGLILMFHSTPARETLEARVTPNPTMEASPRFLESVLLALESRGCRFVSLDELATRVRARKSGGERFVAVTFDDGYRDNLLHASPILRRYHVPWTVYVISGFPDGAVVHYGAIMQDWVASCDELRFELGGRRYAFDASSPQDKARALAGAMGVLGPALANTDWRAFFEDHGVGLGRHTLDADELAELAADPLVTIGAHTHTHPRLDALEANAARLELIRSRERLQAMTGHPVRHVAYPFGAAGPREFALAASLGFDTGVTTRQDYVRCRSASLHALPRLRVSNGDLRSAL